MIIVLDEAYRGLAEGRFNGHELRYYPAGFKDRDAFRRMVSDADVLGMRRVLSFPVDADVLDGADKLAFIHKSGSGSDHFDVEALSERGILLALNTGFNAESVGEHTLCLMLAVLRRTFEYAEIIRAGDWQHALPGKDPRILGGKTVGLIGAGRIAAHVARILSAFNAEILCYHPDPNKDLPENVRWSGLDDLLGASDVISLHMPLTEKTAGMIGEREFALMKPSAILVNTARGGVVDQDALMAALREDRLRGAGLDVFVPEPLPADHPLRTMPNVIGTPHIGGVTGEVAARQLAGTLENIELFLAGTTPVRLVNPDILKNGSSRARFGADSGASTL